MRSAGRRVRSVLSRTLQQAQLVRAATSAEAIALFFERGLEAAAGVRQPLLAAAAAHPGYRVLDGHFTAIRRAMAVPRQNAGRRLRERVYRTLQGQRAGEGGPAAQRPGEVTVAPPAASA